MATRKRSRGEGTVYQRKDGLWIAQVSLGIGPDGKRRRKTISGLDRDEVLRKRTQILAQVQEGTYVEPTQLTVAQWAQEWMEHKQRHVEGHTFLTYEQHVRLHIVPALGKLKLTALQPIHIQRLYDDLLLAGKSPGSVKHTHEVLHNLLNHAVKIQLIAVNPATRVKPPRVPPKPKQFLTFEQAQQWLKLIEGHPEESLFLIAILTGMRQSELLGLRWSDIDWRKGHLTVSQTVRMQKGAKFKPYPKNRKPRVIPLPKVILDKLKEHRKRQSASILDYDGEYHSHNLVWCRENGMPCWYTTLRKHFHKTLDQAGLPRIRFHDLRHTAATLLLALGVPLKEVSEILGHSSIEITADIYAGVLPGAASRSIAKLADSLLPDD